MARIKILIKDILISIFGLTLLPIFTFFSKMLISDIKLLRILFYVPFLVLSYFFENILIRVSAYTQPNKLNFNTKVIKNTRLRALINLSITSPKSVFNKYDKHCIKQQLADEQLDPIIQYEMGHRLFKSGALELACIVFSDLASRSSNKLSLERRIQLYRDCGIAHFMLGHNQEANSYWANAGNLRQTVLGPESTHTYRIIGSSWFAAIGHVAMFDYYIKFYKLFSNKTVRHVIAQSTADVPGNYLLSKFSELGLKLLNGKINDCLREDYDTWALSSGNRTWDHISPAERFALIDDFWEFSFPDGEVLGYTHAAARIQREWENRSLAPLLTVDKEEHQYISKVLDILGIPPDAWYVCLHVREPGFHGSWNSVYPSMRDADIDDYLLAVNNIVKAGGWVIRMGDPTMKRLPDGIPHVVDYAHSKYKTPAADIMIPLKCRFLLGTNSGYTTIPAVFGIPCAFTNWVPIGLPLWPSQDIMIPKLFFDTQRQQYLSLEEIFETGLAYVQNWTDIPGHISLIKNTPDEIWELAEEMMSVTEKNSDTKRLGLAFQKKYHEIASRYGSYTGSHLGSAFIAKYPAIFSLSEQ